MSKPSSPLDWQALYSNYNKAIDAELQKQSLANTASKEHISGSGQVPKQVQSGLMYLVLESELTLKGVRRIVMLSSHDLLYASTSAKCVFLPIDWDKDFNNTVKVHENGVTWQTTFAELVATQPVPLQNLFSRSEIWAEGSYDALA